MNAAAPEGKETDHKEATGKVKVAVDCSMRTYLRRVGSAEPEALRAIREETSLVSHCQLPAEYAHVTSVLTSSACG